MFLGPFGLALATWLFPATLVLFYFGAVFGPPPSVRILAMSGLWVDSSSAGHVGSIGIAHSPAHERTGRHVSGD